MRISDWSSDVCSSDLRRAPAGAHGRDRLQDPVDDRVARIEHRQLRLGFRATALRGADHLDMLTLHDLVMNHARRVVPGFGALAGRAGEPGAPQLVARWVVSALDAFVTHSGARYHNTGSGLGGERGGK